MLTRIFHLAIIARCEKNLQVHAQMSVRSALKVMVDFLEKTTWVLQRSQSLSEILNYGSSACEICH